MKLLLKRVNAIFQPNRLLAAEQKVGAVKSLSSMPEFLERTRQRLRWLQPVLIGLGTVSLGVLAPSTAHALSTGNVSIQMVTDDQLVVDSNYCSSNQGPRAAYVGFKVTNTSGAAINSLQVDLAGLTNGFSLAGGQAVSQYVGTLNVGESRTIYWYVQYAIPCTGGGGFTSIASTLTVTAKDANPGTVSGTGNIQTSSYISANAGGQITSSVLGPGYVAGQLIPYDVTYSFGGASSGDRYNLQPAGNLTYNAACFQLESSRVLSSAVTAIPTGTVDRLFFTASTSQPGSGYQVQIRYFIRYLCANTSTTAKPYAGQTSGNTNKKYTGNYETWIATSFPVGTNAFSISKSASTSNLPNGGNVTYTVTITNTSAYDARIEKIVDTLPTGVTFSGIATGSNVTAANSSSVPAVGASGTITWIGQSPNYYSVPAQSSIKLIYTATIPNTSGSYQNSVSATTGNTTTSTASTTITVGTPVTVSGKVWDDADNSANNTFTNINTGTEPGTNAGGLHAILVNASGNVISSAPVNADGTYSFSNIISGQSNVTIRLSTTAGNSGSAAPTASIPVNWINTSPLVQTAFNIGTTNIAGKDFGIEQLPDTNNVTASSQSNPGGTNTVQVSSLSGIDPEDGNLGTGKSFKIVTLPTNGVLYYNGVAVTVGQVISNYDPTKLTLDPNDGSLTVGFTYAAIDAARKEDPTPATVTMPFKAVVTISGSVFNDIDGNKIQNGTELGTNAGGLNAVLVDSTNKVVAIATVAANGTYSFSNVSGDATYTVKITTATATVGSASPAVILPAGWTNTGENINGTADITVDGQVNVTVTINNVTGANLGIEQLPDTNAVNATSQTNPGGTTQLLVPALSGTDPEDGVLGTGKSFKIVALPTNGTLYYNGTAVTAGQVINNYDSTKLTLDPNDGTLTVSFTYAAIDAAGKEDPTPATVSMPFAAPTVDLSVTKTDGRVSTTAGSLISYTITVTNNGPTTVNSLTLIDALPTSIQSPTFTPNTGAYNSSTGIWTGLNLALGQSITLIVSGTVSTSTVGTLTNTATVSPPSGVTDPTPGNNTATDNTAVYAIAPTAGQIVINEVLYAQTGTGLNPTTNDEFIELYNASSSSVDLSGWKLVDGNLIENSTDSTGSLTGSAVNPAYSFPNGTILAPGQYAVIWIGSNTSDHQAPGATFQTWLNQPPKLNNAGDDVWLYDSQLRIVDYIAYGSGSAVNTPPPTSLNLWNAAYQASLASTNAGQSISLTPNGADGNSSACWEPTTSGQSNGRCTGYLPTTDTDTVATRITTVGQNNNGTVAPNLILVKRITAINGVEVAGFVDDPGSTDDNISTFPSPTSTYLRGAINGGLVRPGDVLEYTIYFLSNGGAPVTNVSICDFAPANSTFVSNAFNGMSPEDTGGLPGVDRGIALGLSTTSFPTAPTAYLSNVQDGDRAQFFPPGTTPPVSCSGINSSGAVVINVVTSPTNLPPATATNTPANSYGFIRFRARVQ
jgi:uncharacterized repeat protein (TIGR01451 family)